MSIHDDDARRGRPGLLTAGRVASSRLTTPSPQAGRVADDRRGTRQQVDRLGAGVDNAAA